MSYLDTMCLTEINVSLKHCWRIGSGRETDRQTGRERKTGKERDRWAEMADRQAEKDRQMDRDGRLTGRARQTDGQRWQIDR